MSLTGKSPSETYKDLIYVNNSNNGIPSDSARPLKSGNGIQSSLGVDDRRLQVKSSTNNTTAFEVKNASDTSKFLVDTTNNYVKANGVHVNTQYATFGANASSLWSTAAANKHNAVPFDNINPRTVVTIGTSTDPDTSFSIANTADDIVNCYWFIMDNITIDRVVWWSGADAATGDTTRCHLMSYDIDTDNGSTGGDLSSGVVLADGADITNAGYEQSYYQQMTIQSADVTAGKVVLFTLRSDSVNSDFSINATIKYHITG